MKKDPLAKNIVCTCRRCDRSIDASFAECMMTKWPRCCGVEMRVTSSSLNRAELIRMSRSVAAGIGTVVMREVLSNR